MNKQEKIKKVVEAFLAKDYGETLTHDEIAYTAQVKEGTQAYRSIIQAAQRKTLECGKMIENVRGIGYRIVPPDEYTQQSAKCVIGGARRIDKGAKILQNAPVKDMSVEGIQRYNAVTDRMKMLQAAVTGARCEINMLSSERKHPLTVIEGSTGRAS